MRSSSGLRRPIPITGWSLTSGLGNTTEEAEKALRAGRRGLSRSPIAVPFETSCGVVAQGLEALPANYKRYDCRQARIALLALEGIRDRADDAVTRWGRERCAVILATTTGGIERTESALYQQWEHGEWPEDYDFFYQHDFQAFGRLIKQTLGYGGPCFVISTACSSSVKILSAAARMMSSDYADAVLVGGVDSLSLTTLHGFNGLGILNPEPCSPFGESGHGINLGEGGAFLLLERSGDSDLALLGVGESSDAHHMSSPHPDGDGSLRAMQLALEQADLEPHQVDYINAHGTATKHNDRSEARALARLFKEPVPVVSTKGYTGHMLGAAGVAEAVISILSVRQGWIPANVAAAPIDQTLGITVNSAFRELSCDVALNNAFGFGGNNGCALFGRRS